MKPGLTLFLASLGGALLVGALLAWTPALERIENATLDWRFRLRPALSSPSPVTVVFLRGIQDGGEERPLREQLAAFLGLLSEIPKKQQPAAVVLDMVLTGPGDTSEPGSPTALLVEMGTSLGNLVHGLQLAFHANEQREQEPDRSLLLRHSLPSSGDEILRVAYGMRLAHPRLAPKLYSGAAGAGFINLSPLPGVAGGVAHHLPLLAGLLEEHPSSTETGGTRLSLALSLAGVGAAICQHRALDQCMHLKGSNLRIEGSLSRTVPLDPTHGGEFWINHRRRFQLAPDSLASDRVSATDASVTPPEVVLFDTRAQSQFITPDGRLLSPDQLAGQLVLVADMLEPNTVRSPFGEDFRQASLHAQVMANILEDDFLRRLPLWSHWLAALGLLSGALAWHPRRLRQSSSAPSRETWPRDAGSREAGPRDSGSLVPALKLVITAPEGLLAVGWTGIAIGLFRGWSVWLPIALPLGMLLGSALGRRLFFPWVLRQELARLTMEESNREQVLEALATRTAELGELRAQLAEVTAPPRGPEAASPLLPTTDELSVADVRELDQLLELAQRVLEEQLPQAAEGSLAVTTWREAPAFSERLRQARLEVQRLLKELQESLQTLKQHRSAGQTLARWLEVRRAAYEALLGQVRGMLFEAADQLEQLRPSLAGKMLSLDAAPMADPAILERTGCMTRDPGMLELLRDVLTRIGPSQLQRPVLILGESGTGKELIARAIHRTGPHPEAPLVSFNCASLSPNLVDSELFGHVKGAFTGADRDRTGLWVEADGGTLFLDELGEMPLELQAKVLRAVELGEVRPVGGTARQARKVRVRLVAATHVDLEQGIQDGRFRLDLFHRLNGSVVRLPPLRDRKGDVALLSRLFVREASVRLQQEILLEEGAVVALEGYRWPGNVRELKNVLEDLADRPGLHRIAAADVRARLGISEIEPELSERDVFTPEERALLELLRQHQFQESACGDDPAYPGNRAAAGRHLRVLMCKALRATRWARESAARLLAGETQAALAPLLELRIQHLLRSLMARLEPVEDSTAAGDGGKLPHHGILSESTHAAIKRQYRSDFLHVIRVLEALRLGHIVLDTSDLAQAESEE